MNDLSLVELEVGTYKPPKRNNENIPSEKYDAIDKACKENIVLNKTDGNAYIPETSFPKIISKKKKSANYIMDNKIAEEDKKSFNNTTLINTSAVVGYLDKNSHLTRDAEIAELNRYARDGLISIGDSSQAEAIRRKIDSHVDKELPKLKKKRNSSFDEITGEPLEKNAAFHHVNNKEIYNEPQQILDVANGIVVNPDTHNEIHRRNIFDGKMLTKQKEDIKKTVLSSKK